MFFIFFFFYQQWRAADAEMKVPSGENTELKRFPLKAWSRLVDNIREWTGLESGKSQRAVENREKRRKLVEKNICNAPTTLAVKGLMMMMIMCRWLWYLNFITFIYA